MGLFEAIRRLVGALVTLYPRGTIDKDIEDARKAAKAAREASKKLKENDN